MLKLVAALLLGAQLFGAGSGQLRFCLRNDPKTFDPLLVEDDSAETIRYLTGGVLVRLNRSTQELEPELATSWKISPGGRSIAFELRPNVQFSDGAPFSCEDVVHTMRMLMDPSLHSPTGDAFRSAPGPVDAQCAGLRSVTIRFPAPLADVAAQFDQIAILPAHPAGSRPAVLGPFLVREYRPGSYVLLDRNPNYWKRDASGKRLPYFDSVRLDIQMNRELELLRFRRGELDLIGKLDPEMFDRLAAEHNRQVVDAGPSFDWEVVFFNQALKSPAPAYKTRWFRSKAFRRAISESINREDICRLVYRGHASPAAGPVSASNRFWLNGALKPHPYSPQAALDRLAKEGFRRSGNDLFDASGRRVEFSIVTNAGNRLHERMAAMIQQDLAKIGVRLNVVTLDFASLIERISRTLDYDACLMAFTNLDLDPNNQMNIWLSSASTHPWSPGEKTPQTPWEERIDRLMQAQTTALDRQRRKAYFDEVQQIVWEEAPMLYLVNPNTLSAVSSELRNVAPAALRPQLFWNVERLSTARTYLSKR